MQALVQVCTAVVLVSLRLERGLWQVGSTIPVGAILCTQACESRSAPRHSLFAPALYDVKHAKLT